jgi:tRNA/tmRNA/rRNA uracil-C5-methylase (TrmA/RlmC/RlmD family)
MALPAAEGDVLELAVGEPAHGGWCVARLDEDTRFVVFVRHALPGERVRAVVTQVTARFARADAIEIISASPDRVRPPCPYARPDGCGGCDWQHASLPAQRAIKAQVVSQQLRRIAGIDRAVTVRPLPGAADGLGWRTRVSFAVGDDGQAGLRKHRSNEIVPVGDCLIAHPLVTEAEVTRQLWVGARSVEVAVAPRTGQRAIMVDGYPSQDPSERYLIQRAAGRDWQVSATGFWQVHPEAADTLAEAVLAGLAPRPGETALDLFCGAGLFAGVLATAVGSTGAVIAVEKDRDAVRDARHNLRQTPWARVHRGDAAEVIGRIGLSGASIAVLDPPRTGVSRQLVDSLCTGPGLRRIAYVSCDPATLARDIAVFAGHGWGLAGLVGYDAFPMTHHVECLAILEPPAG